MSRLLSDEQLALWRADGRPWTDDVDVEKDYLLDRLVVEFFNDPMLADRLVYAGGTCLHKVHAPVPGRFSEDLDFVIANPTDDYYWECRSQMSRVIRAFAEREQIDLLVQRWKMSEHAGQLMDYTDVDGYRQRLKVDLARKPALAASAVNVRYQVSSNWFSATVDLPCEPPATIAATKIVALTTRRKPRDLFDLYFVQRELGVQVDDIIQQMPRVELAPSWNARTANETLDGHAAHAQYLEELDRILTGSPLDYEPAELFTSARETLMSVGTGIGREISKKQRRKLQQAARKQREAEQ